MEVEKIIPVSGKVYMMEQYVLLHILEGSGAIQVDFKNYLNWDNKLIYLNKGQYISFLADGFVVRKITIPDENVFHNKEVRVLFNHLVSLGYINFHECEDCRKYLSGTISQAGPSEIIDVSTEQWFWQNPFSASREEYQLIFDLKEVIDLEYQNHLSTAEFCQLIDSNGFKAQALVRDKVGLTIHRLVTEKRLLEGKRDIAFSDKSIKEVSYKLGFNDPGYFNRFFKKGTGRSPGEFRKSYQTERKDSFLENVFELIREHHQEVRELSFYADKLNISVKTLSRKVRERLNLSLGQVLRQELVRTAMRMLEEGMPVVEIAFKLGFSEPNHFSAFFRKHTGITPTEFKNKKYNQ